MSNVIMEVVNLLLTVFGFIFIVGVAFIFLGSKKSGLGVFDFIEGIIKAKLKSEAEKKNQQKEENNSCEKKRK